MSIKLNIDLGRAGEADYNMKMGYLRCGGMSVVWRVVQRTTGVDVFFWEALSTPEKFRFLRIMKGKTSKQVVAKFRKTYKCGSGIR